MRAGTILIVDDEPGQRELLTLTLEAYGYDVAEAANGLEALAAVAGFCDPGAAVVPDAILLDVHMPVMGGVEFAGRYRALIGDPAPIIMMTASSDGRAAATYAGAVALLQKPIAADALLNAIEASCTSGSAKRIALLAL
jgi:CheY-like chemotaxis protein